MSKTLDIFSVWQSTEKFLSFLSSRGEGGGGKTAGPPNVEDITDRLEYIWKLMLINSYVNISLSLLLPSSFSLSLSSSLSQSQPLLLSLSLFLSHPLSLSLPSIKRHVLSDEKCCCQLNVKWRLIRKIRKRKMKVSTTTTIKSNPLFQRKIQKN